MKRTGRAAVGSGPYRRAPHPFMHGRVVVE